MEDIRIGNGYDVHRLSDGLKLVLCGVPIEYDRGCVAHSDGDVALHALCDALLGALALGDIGKHFPDSSDEYLGIDSTILLDRVVAMVEEKGYRIGNVDITVALQRPKMAPYIQQMRETVAAHLHTVPDRVSVKATTTERLGFVGREEGVEVYAVALIEKEY